MTGAVRWVRTHLRPEEALLATYGLAIVVLGLFTGSWQLSPVWHQRFLACALVLASGLALREYLRRRTSEPPGPALRASLRLAAGVVRDFLPFHLTLVLYETLHDLTPLLRPHVVDAALIAIDHALFRVDAAVWLGRIASPLLTKVLVGCYLSYFLAPGVLAALLYATRPRAAFRSFMVSACLATFLGFSGYLLVPAVGPYIFQAPLFPARLPGGETGFASEIVATIDAIKGAHRDCFPSLHTAHTTLVLIFAARYLRPWFWVYLPVAVGLFVATLYLRMHYAIDVVAGWATAAAAAYLGPRLERAWSPAQAA